PTAGAGGDGGLGEIGRKLVAPGAVGEPPRPRWIGVDERGAQPTPGAGARQAGPAPTTATSNRAPASTAGGRCPEAGSGERTRQLYRAHRGAATCAPT